MVADINLDGNRVVVSGNWLFSRTTDILLDSPERRSNKSGNRRALVHDFNDGLTINWANDYPGGVTIRGKASVDILSAVDASVVAMSVEKASIELISVGGTPFARRVGANTNADRIVLGTAGDGNAIQLEGRGLQIDGSLQVRSAGIFDQPIQVPDVSLVSQVEGNLQPPTRSVAAMLQDLQDQINVLEAKVAALENS